MNLHLLAAIFSGLFFAFGGIIYKIGNKHLVRDPLRYLLFYNIFRVFVVASLLPWVSLSLPRDLWLTFFLYTFSFFLGTLLTAVALVHLDTSIFMPLFNLQIIFTPLIAFFFLKERLSPVAYLLMAVVFLGGFLVTFSEGSRRRRALFDLLLKRFGRADFKLPLAQGQSLASARLGVLALFVVGLVFYSFSDNFAGRVLKEWNVANLVFWSGLCQFLFSLGLVPFIKGREEFNLAKIWPIAIGVATSFLGLLLIIFGFAENVSLSQALSRLSSVYALILVVLLARFRGDFLEKHPPYVYAVRFLGSGVMVLAAAALLFVK